MESDCLLSLLTEQGTHFKSNKRDKMEAHILGVQISDMTLNNVALPIALSGEKSWSYTGPCGKKLRKKNFSFRVGRYQEIRPTTPC